MTGSYDLVVVGGGPAGSTMAALVKKYNPAARVLIVEKAAFPRHHVGESLLPGMIPVLKELGVFDKINREGFPKKFGVVFVWGKDRKPWDADFNNLNLEMLEKHGRLLDTEFSWQVLRSRYDEILLDHAKTLGVETLTARAVSPVESHGKVVGVVVQEEGRKARTLRCRMLADCSGQNGFLAKARKTRAYRSDLKNVAAYAYFKGAKWKFEYAGHPDKTKIFVCSVPQGWFWYIPLSKERVSVGLVSKAGAVKQSRASDYRAYFTAALKACPEIWPLLKDAQWERGVDPAAPEKDFFTASDWSYENTTACGDGWLAAGDAAFFIDPLLSSGVMMAHLSGHRAAYTLTTAWREKDAEVSRALWSDYDVFCKEVSGSFLALVQYWYHHDPNAQRWWKTARKTLGVSAGLDLGDKAAFVAVAAGLTYYFERAYTAQTLVFGNSGVEHSWQWEGTKLELKRWTRQILAIVDTGFLKSLGPKQAGVKRAEAQVALQEIPDAWVPRWVLRRRKELTFLPDAQIGKGLLFPVRRLRLLKTVVEEKAAQASNPRRILPGSYMTLLDLIDGKRSVGALKAALYETLSLPRDIIDGQVFRLLKDLAVLGALELKPGKTKTAAPAGGAFRGGEAALRAGDVPAAERWLSEAIAAGQGGAWAFALRGEARRHLGRLDEGLADLDEALRLNGRPREAKGSRLDRLLGLFDASIERGWTSDRILIFRAKLRLQLSDAAGARADAEAALSANPRQSEGFLVRAKAAMAQGDLSAAQADLKLALAIETAGKKGQG